MTPTLSVIRALLRKELLVELRTLESVPGMSLFAVTTFVVFHFALNRNSIDGDLAAGEGGVKNRQVADDEGDQAKAHAGLEDHDGASAGGDGHDVAEAEGKKRGAGDIKVSEEGEVFRAVADHHGIVEGCAERKEDQPEARNEDERPDNKQQNKREGTIRAVELLADAGITNAAGQGGPGRPGDDIEEMSGAKAAGRTTRKNDGLKGVKQDDEDEGDAHQGCKNVHGEFLPRLLRVTPPASSPYQTVEAVPVPVMGCPVDRGKCLSAIAATEFSKSHVKCLRR